MSASGPRDCPKAVKEVFDAFDGRTRHELLAVRALIFAAADELEVPLQLVETLKWGQVSYHPKRPRVGSTVRLGRGGREESVGSVYFHCQTGLLDTFRERYPDTLTFVANREIVLDRNWSQYASELQHCVALALTYHQWK